MAGVNTSKITAKDANGLSLADDSGTAYITIADGGDVGVGITAPSDYIADKRNLVLGSTSAHTGMTIVCGATHIGTIQFRSNTTNNDIEGWIDYSQNSKNMRFGTNGLNTRMTIDSAGKVGIGVSSPASKLDITEASAAVNMQLSYDASNYASFNVDANGALTIETVDAGAGTSGDLTFNVDGQISMTTANAAGAGGGFDGAPTLTVKVAKINGIIETTILVDIEGLRGSASEACVVGEAGVAAAYITQITTAVNGVIFKAEMACIETPVVSGGTNNPDIDLVAAPTSYAQGADYTAGSGESSLVTCGGTGWVAGHHEKSNNGPGGGSNLAVNSDDYLYLATGDAHGHNTNNYSAGKFVIKLYGASF
jgi:hypothetical protein